MSSINTDFDTHVKTYRGFVRGLRYAAATAAVTLIGLAWYLL
ncbi:MAG: aa3-type cytochrome c oxidase subunit IV [Hyphomicrobium sp.]|jgi:Bacterial aa3 type cytochrome c oxidase subunit IV